MVYTLFFSRMRDLSPELRDEYDTRAGALHALATAQYPGFVDLKTYVAEDGERLTVVRFENAESQRAWKLDATHREAQARGREVYYDRFRIVVCEEVRSREWARAAGEEVDA